MRLESHHVLPISLGHQYPDEPVLPGKTARAT
jgi:hypothetical protein